MDYVSQSYLLFAILRCFILALAINNCLLERTCDMATLSCLATKKRLKTG